MLILEQLLKCRLAFFFRVYVKLCYDYIMSNKDRAELHSETSSVNEPFMSPAWTGLE